MKVVEFYQVKWANLPVGISMQKKGYIIDIPDNWQQLEQENKELRALVSSILGVLRRIDTLVESDREDGYDIIDALTDTRRIVEKWLDSHKEKIRDKEEEPLNPKTIKEET